MIPINIKLDRPIKMSYKLIVKRIDQLYVKIICGFDILPFLIGIIGYYRVLVDAGDGQFNFG
jgi:hypothetical protein